MPVPTDLKSVVRKDVRVRLPPSAPMLSITYRQSSSALEFTLRTLVRCARHFCANCGGKLTLQGVKTAPILDHLVKQSDSPRINLISTWHRLAESLRE